ncbi:hypothetical protein [Myceligenerans crystallogenes]|uniref:Uncharacterized protein n=1 Tax=Myceligenerans crystallogenes TaxID=316335 RepID=A0ABN2N306_9MICO
MAASQSTRLPLRRRLRPDGGQAVIEYVGVVAVVMLVVLAIVLGATPVGASISEQLLCAVESVDGEAEDCVGGTGEPGGGGTGSPTDAPSGDPSAPPTGDCETDVTFDAVNVIQQWATSVVQIGCEWYPVPTKCFAEHMPEGYLDREPADRVYNQDAVPDFVTCVTEGRGGPSEDPNDPNCANAVPTSGEFDEDAPPVVQVGCKELPVPKGCEDEWANYENAEPGKDRAAASGWLANCVADKYQSMEPPCVVETTGHVDQTKGSFLFFRWGETNGTLIEKLGDGRIRIHILKGVELGAGISGDNVGGSPISFDVAGITGYESDKTYEFTDMTKAQEWIDWYKKYDAVNGKHATPYGCTRGPCYVPDPYPEMADNLRDEEPEHHELSESDSKITKVSLKGGLSMGGSAGQFELKGSIEGGYEGEVQVEERLFSDGSQVATYTSSDIGGFLIGAKLGGKQPFTKDKNGKPTSSGGGGAGGKVGMEWKGTTSSTVVWDKDGQLSKLIITMDDQVMRTLYQAGIDVSVALPYGFTIGGGYKKEEQAGTISTRQMILDFNQYPELREVLGPEIDEVFPRDAEGRLIKDDVVIDGNDEQGGELYDAADEYGNVRELKYDAEKVTEGGDFKIGWEGLNLFKTEWVSVDEERTLSESSFEVTDVDGNKQTTSPAPQCRAKDFEAPDDYYETDFSDPPTHLADSGHPTGSEHFPNDKPKYTEGTYPGTDYSGDVPKDRAERTHSLLDEYSRTFPDKNILVVKDFGNFSFRTVSGYEHLATVDGFDVIAIDSGTVKNNGDGGWINWGFQGSYDYNPDTKTVKFK